MRISYRLVFSAIGVIAAVLAVFCFRPTLPERVAIASGAAILYYNSPAAVQYGSHVSVGYIRSDGVVEVATVDLNTEIVSRHFVHDYGRPDDHSAPALHAVDDGLLVATSLHSSSLFLYKIDQAGGRNLVCSWNGRFSYPRFEDVGGATRLFVRLELGNSGDIAEIDDLKMCSDPHIIQKAEPGNWLYATVPNSGKFAWSVYNQKANRHTQAFIDGTPAAVDPSSLKETLMWSIAGTYAAVTHFQNAFVCCHSGEMVAELYSGAELIYRSDPLPNPFYPTGIVISPNAAEATVPVSEHGFVRREIPSMMPLVSCPQNEEINTRAQYVEGGGGSYVWMESRPPLSGSEFSRSNIALCLVEPLSQ